MKTKIYLISSVFSLISFEKNYAQPWQITGNGNATAASFVGHANSVPLQIKTTLAQPISFFTNNTQKMIITSTGFVGIGNGFTTPQSRLHLHQLGASFIYTQWTTGTTGNANANQGLRIGVAANGIAELRQQENFNMNFFTNNTQRVSITADGALLYNSTTGATPASGAGTRMMWIPDKAAFRAG